MAINISFDTFHNIVGNQPRPTQATFQGIDPTNGKALWDAPIATQDDLDAAVTAASAAFKKWSLTTPAQRGEHVAAFVGLVQEHKEQLASVLSREGGKPIGFATSEILMGIGTLKAHATYSVEDQILKDTEDVTITLQHAPLGVAAGITPWNFPFQLAVLKIAAAVMAGCTTIIKPSPYTPYTTIKLVEIASHVFPSGVVQVLSGDEKLGPMITTHPGISKISFTGSIASGKKVMAAASGTLKRVNLELGGNDAAIVTEDFDMAKAAELVAVATFSHSGQICFSTKRVYVHESVYDEFMRHFTAIVKGYKLGEGYMSPIQNKMQFDKVKDIYKDCEDQQYTFAVGEGRVRDRPSEAGYFIEPAVIAKPPDNSRIVQEEPFGPIIPVLTWTDEADVLARVNDTVTGLGGMVYCNNKERAMRLSSGLETGSVWVNGGLKIDPIGLVGAHKQSGIGGELGPLGLKFYTNTRTVTFWKEGALERTGGLF